MNYSHSFSLFAKDIDSIPETAVALWIQYALTTL